MAVAGFEPGPTSTVAAQASFAGPERLHPDFDPIDLLPAKAAERLRLLRQRSDDLHAVIPAFEEIREASMARQEADRALRRLTDHRSAGGFELLPDDARVVAAQRALDTTTAGFARIKERAEVRSAAWQAASQGLAAVETWLKTGRPGGTALEDFEAPEPKLSKGETVLDAIERLRRRGRELKADLHRIRSAPYPSAHARSQMRKQIEALAQRGAPDVASLIELDAEVVWPKLSVQSAVFNAQPGAVTFADVSDALGLIAWTFKDQLIKRLDAEIATEADDATAMSHEQRQKAEAEVQGDLLAVERAECALVWQAQAQGLPVEHRADCSPLAILQVRLVTAPRAEASDTTPGFSWLRR